MTATATTTTATQPGPAWHGLATTQTTYTTPRDDGATWLTVSVRTETFVADVADKQMPGCPLHGKAFIWRTEITDSAGWDSPAAGDVTYSGFMATGRQALHYRGDADAARYLRTRRNGKNLVPASTDPDYERAADRYQQMMSY